MPEFAQTVLEFLKTHQAWAPPIVFVLAFAESLALVALLVPATVILWGVGALIGAAGLDFWPIWLAAAIGGGLGDWLSYWLGYHYHEQIARMWPIRNYPDLLPRLPNAARAVPVRQLDIGFCMGDHHADARHHRRGMAERENLVGASDLPCVAHLLDFKKRLSSFRERRNNGEGHDYFHADLARSGRCCFAWRADASGVGDDLAGS